jgi:formate hydrogenlyase subunit 3/multisubunit Na+/H+ antiporter MnhD subunit
MNAISKALIIFGIIFIIAGVLFQFTNRVPWLGRLPGDIYIKKDNFSFYFPITTSIIISAIISLVLYILGRR